MSLNLYALNVNIILGSQVLCCLLRSACRFADPICTHRVITFRRNNLWKWSWACVFSDDFSPLAFVYQDETGIFPNLTFVVNPCWEKTRWRDFRERKKSPAPVALRKKYVCDNCVIDTIYIFVTIGIILSLTPRIIDKLADDGMFIREPINKKYADYI